MAERRSLYYASILYSESVAKNWEDILQESHVSYILSPLHDKDINPVTNEEKKAHYHLVLLFESVKSQAQAKDIFDSIGGVGCEVVKSLRGMARYLCHLDNPEKAQYSPHDVKVYGGYDYQEMIGSPADRLLCISEMMDFIDRNQVIYFSEFMRWCRTNNNIWFKYLCESCGYVIKEYIKAYAYELRNEYPMGE